MNGCVVHPMTTLQVVCTAFEGAEYGWIFFLNSKMYVFKYIYNSRLLSFQIILNTSFNNLNFNLVPDMQASFNNFLP